MPTLTGQQWQHLKMRYQQKLQAAEVNTVRRILVNAMIERESECWHNGKYEDVGN
jgi:hypothetical protein